MSSVFWELWSHPRLRSLVLSEVERTGKTLGSGSYGVVEEVTIPGAVCAAKKIRDFILRDDPDWMARETVEARVQKFISECALLSRLRHPHIVQFIGFWMEKESLVHLVMEKMVSSLHDLLEPNDPSSQLHGLPLSLKCSVLQDIARGLAFLHKQSPPVIHRDLSARNVLLDSAMTAKIADLGMARNLLPTRDGSFMTAAPGALVYMPPEALENSSKYDTSIDIFSFGVILIFTLGERFPRNVKSSTYTNEDKGVLVARTELERREEYTRKIYTLFPLTSSLITLMESCLHNSPKYRPSIDGVASLLREAVKEIGDESKLLHTKSKLELIQMLEKSLKESELLKESITWTKEDVTMKPKDKRKSKSRPHRLKRVTKESISWPQEVVKTSLVSPTQSDTLLKTLKTLKFPKIRSSQSVDELSKEGSDPVSDVCNDLNLLMLPERETTVYLAHQKKENWFKDISREEAKELLVTCDRGTFLVRPSSQATRETSGAVHTHTIDIMCNDINHIKVFLDNTQYFLQGADVKFTSLEDLIHYYMKHHLISYDTFLTFPLFSKQFLPL